jgi:hypothetical protein
MRPKIQVKHPDGQTEVVELSRERTIVGRGAEAHIRINDSRVSREHCALEVEGERVYVVDLGGNNGTWVGPAKLLANIREPFPEEVIVHVGPAQLRNATRGAAYDPSNDLESRAFMPAVAASKPAADGRGSGQVASAATLELNRHRVTINPGERNSLELAVSNQSKIVDHYTLSVTGLPPTWITLPKAGVELLPRQNGNLIIDLHPPRHPRTSAGVHPINIALLNKQGQIVTEARAELEVTPFDNMVLDVRPNPYQSRSGGTLVLTVENQGNAQTDYRVDALEASDGLEISVEPPTAQVAPQQKRENMLVLRPRKRLWIGEPKRMPINLTVSSTRQSVTAMPVYIQTALIPRWLPIVLGLCCCVLIPLFAFLAWEPVQPILFPTETPAPTQTATLVPPTNTPTPDLPATVTATHEVWLIQDDDQDGLLNGEELEIETEPDRKDTDGDGLSDYDEVKTYSTNPLNIDTDGDTLTDGAEVTNPCLSPITNDTDIDGVQDHLDPNSCQGITPTPSPVPDFGLGGQLSSEENLGVADDARMTWIKKQIRFSPGANAATTAQDAAAIKQEGYKILLSVLGNREDLAGGGAYNQQFAEFVAGLAPVADAIEVWNEPNIDAEWLPGQISGAAYTELLRVSYNAIKNANPATLVISAAPAPTGLFGGGCRAEGCDDSRFIQDMMAAGARGYMDCVGIHYNQGATPPSATSGHPHGDHYSYYFLQMVDLYWNTFNPADTARLIPLCFTEIGFVSDDGFDLTLAQAGATGFLWAEGISDRDQAAWLEEALLLSCRSGKIKLFIVWNIDFTTYDRDPQAGYAILRPDEDCPSCETLSRAVGILRNEGCMR